MEPGARLKQLADMATMRAKVNHNIAPKMYLRSAIQLEQQARSYYEDEDWASSYVLSVRFCHLVLQELPAHPKYKEVPQVEKERARKKVKMMLERAEELKKKLNAMFMAEYDKKKKDELRQKKEEERQRLEEEQRRQHKLKEEQRVLEERQKKVEEERQKLEQKRRDEIAAAAAAAASYNIPTASIMPLQMDGHHPQQPLITQPPPMDHVIIPGVSPVVDRSNKPVHLMQQELPPPYPETQQPYPETQQPYPQTQQPHPQTQQPHPQAQFSSQGPQPVVDRSTKPSSAISDVYLSGIETLQTTGGLRMVQVPQNIAQDFLNAASSNTRRNVETGGFLAGKLSRNVFKITHLILPQQEGNSDNFITRNEEEYFEEMEKHDLIQLGWIHTHPSQTSFLSSIDLHLQLYHQGMLEEAIAIVAAPKYSQVGYYHLTAHGLDVIGNCQQTGFHPHPKHPPLFEDCKHIQHEPATSVIVVDLRR